MRYPKELGPIPRGRMVGKYRRDKTTCACPSCISVRPERADVLKRLKAALKKGIDRESTAKK